MEQCDTEAQIAAIATGAIVSLAFFTLQDNNAQELIRVVSGGV